MQTENFKKNRIGIFSASSSVAYLFPKRVLEAKKLLEQKGYYVELGNLYNQSDFYRSASIKQRANEFNSLLKNNDILMSMIGGFNSSSILNQIDYQYIKKNKIKIIGYSDTTAILLAVYQKTKIPTYYGPALLPSFVEDEYIREYHFNQLEKVLIKNELKEIKTPIKWTDRRIDWSLSFDSKYKKKFNENSVVYLNKMVATGRLIGGNLHTMTTIIGTEFMPEIKKGDILFIEDSFVNIDICERNFALLKNAKILDLVSGIIIGKIEGFNNQGSNRKYHEVLFEFINRKIPIIYNFDSSHCLPMNILKIGSTIKMDTINKKVIMLD